jgi:hypothetical protein
MSLHTLTLILAGLATPLGAFAQAVQAPPATSSSQSGDPSAAAGPAAAVPRPPIPSSAQSEAGEPRAMTSEAAPAPAAGPAQGPAPRSASGRSPGSPASGSHATAGAAPAGKPTAADRLELGTATVTGDREQPKVMYIVPWKRSDIGDLSGKPMNSLLDEALAPVDRDEFKRQVMYYQVVKADASQNGAAKAPAAQGEK